MHTSNVECLLGNELEKHKRIAGHVYGAGPTAPVLVRWLCAAPGAPAYAAAKGLPEPAVSRAGGVAVPTWPRVSNTYGGAAHTAGLFPPQGRTAGSGAGHAVMPSATQGQPAGRPTGKAFIHSVQVCSAGPACAHIAVPTRPPQTSPKTALQQRACLRRQLRTAPVAQPGVRVLPAGGRAGGWNVATHATRFVSTLAT